MKYINTYKSGKLSGSISYNTMEEALNTLNQIIKANEMMGYPFNKVSDTEWVRNNRTYKIEDKGDLTILVCGMWETFSAHFGDDYLPYEMVKEYLFKNVLANTDEKDIERKVYEFAKLYYENPKEKARINWEIQTSIYKK